MYSGGKCQVRSDASCFRHLNDSVLDARPIHHAEAFAERHAGSLKRMISARGGRETSLRHPPIIDLVIRSRESIPLPKLPFVFILLLSL